MKQGTEMKSFRSVLLEAPQLKTRVLLFGRMNPVTKGHEENVNAAHKIAQKHNAELHVIASHSHDAKKNPLSPEQKATHLKRAFGHLSNTHVGTSSKESPTILHQAAAAHKAGVQHLVIAGGGDRAAEYHKLLHTYNGHEGGKHGYYKFKKISIENTGERKEGVSGTDMRKHAAGGHFDKFRAGLPSKIAANEKHSREAFNDVRHGMGVHEDSRETYVSGQMLRLGESVVDTFTGFEGKIVYRGPTYVTIQVDEELSFKRWIKDVDSIEEQSADAMLGFGQYNVPNDIAKNLLGSLNYCPLAVKAFTPLLGNSKYDQGLVLEAIDATAHYLSIEKRAAEIPGSIDDHGVTEFNEHMRHAAHLLEQLGVLEQHRGYMEKHSHAMMKLTNSVKEEKRPHEIQGHEDITDEDLKAIEKHIDSLEWDDIKHLYGDTQKKSSGGEGDTVDEELELEEGLTAAQRINKKFQFLKSKSKREIAAQVARHRVSTGDRLKKRAITHARTMIMQRLLKGRSKASLSAAEKDRIESIVSKAKSAVVRISNRLMPKLRELEMKRLRHVKEHNQLTDKVYDSEAHAVETVAANDTNTAGNPKLAHVKAHLSGVKPDEDPGEGISGKQTIKRLKQFRKMET